MLGGAAERGPKLVSSSGVRRSRAAYCIQQNLTVHVMHMQVASMMPSDEAEAPLEYQKGSIGAIAER